MPALRLPTRHVELLALGLDVDGVLRDTAYISFVAGCNAVTELGGTPPEFDAFVRDYEADYRSYWTTCGVSDVEAIRPTYLRHLGAIEHFPPFDDVNDFLQLLRKKQFKVFTVSSHPTAELHRWFAEHGIDDHLLCVYGSSTNKGACIRNACAEINVDPARAAYIGDWGLDMRAAKATGALPIGITRGYPSRDALLASGAVHVVDHLYELSDLIF